MTKSTRRTRWSLVALAALALSGHPEDPTLPPPPQLPAGPWSATTSWDLTAWSGPWGISYPMNLTPDENTGLGIWTEEMFVKAMRTGRHMGASRPILPPMPWQSLASLDDADLEAVYAYLRSLPPIKNRVPEAVIAEPVVADAKPGRSRYERTVSHSRGPSSPIGVGGSRRFRKIPTAGRDPENERRPRPV